MLSLQHLWGPLMTTVMNFLNLEDSLKSCLCIIRLENLVYENNLSIDFIIIVIINTALIKLRMLRYFIAEQIFLIFLFTINHNRH